MGDYVDVKAFKGCYTPSCFRPTETVLDDDQCGHVISANDPSSGASTGVVHMKEDLEAGVAVNPLHEEVHPLQKHRSRLNSEQVAIIAKLFEQYDIDRSGTINTADELEQLSINAVFKLGLRLDQVAFRRVVDTHRVFSGVGQNPLDLLGFVTAFESIIMPQICNQPMQSEGVVEVQMIGLDQSSDIGKRDANAGDDNTSSAETILAQILKKINHHLAPKASRALGPLIARRLDHAFRALYMLTLVTYMVINAHLVGNILWW